MSQGLFDIIRASFPATHATPQSPVCRLTHERYTAAALNGEGHFCARVVKMELEGILFTYNSKPRLAAFRTKGPSSRYFVYVPGLTDGLLEQSFLPPLADAVGRMGYTFVQPVLSSSYSGYGISSLARDCEELNALLEHLVQLAAPARPDIVVMGHSTGCQDWVWYLAHGRHTQYITHAILQAPASDRDYLDTLPTTAAARTKACELHCMGLGDTLLAPSETSFGHPMTAYRFHALSARMADDDMFSWDLTCDELKQKLGHIALPILLVYSLADEYVPPFVDVRELARRMERAMASPRCEAVFVEGAKHSLEGHEQQLISAITSFIPRKP